MALTVKHTIDTPDGVETITLTPRKAIRKKCLECSGWSATQARECHITTCALWPYRMPHGAESIEKQGE